MKLFSLVIPVLNEVQCFDETLRILRSQNEGHLLEILVVVCERTCAESLKVARRHQGEAPGQIHLIEQTRPYLGGALLEGIRHAKGDHILILYSDLESDPTLVPEFIRLSRKHPDAIIQASRLVKGGRFEGYGCLKGVLNYTAQMGLRLLYGGKATDFTFGYRCYPSRVAKSLPVTELRHGFVLETLLLAIRQGVVVVEIPCVWQKRSEGTSQITLATYAHYLPLALRTRFRRLPGPGTPNGEA